MVISSFFVAGRSHRCNVDVQARIVVDVLCAFEYRKPPPSVA